MMFHLPLSVITVFFIVLSVVFLEKVVVTAGAASGDKPRPSPRRQPWVNPVMNKRDNNNNNKDSGYYKEWMSSLRAGDSTTKGGRMGKLTIATTAAAAAAASGSSSSSSSSVATAVAKQSAASIRETLLEKLQSIPEWSLRDKFLSFTALVAATLSSTILWMEGTLLMDAVAWLCLGLGGTSAVMSQRLSEYDTMRQLTSQLNEQVNNLHQANQALKHQNTKLTSSARQLQKCQSQLQHISQQQGVSIHTLVQQVEAYKQIQQQVSEKVRAQIQQTILSIVVGADQDQDYIIRDGEMETLILRLSHLPSIQFNASKFRSAMKRCKGSIVTFLNRHLTDASVVQKEQIFAFQQQQQQ